MGFVFGYNGFGVKNFICVQFFPRNIFAQGDSITSSLGIFCAYLVTQLFYVATKATKFSLNIDHLEKKC